MKIDVTRTELRLEGKQSLAIRDGIGYEIAAREGSVWLTQEHDLRDIVLQAGERFVMDRPGLALVEACGPAVIAFSKARRQAVARYPEA